nr:replication factor A protein 1-like [Ipomoea batatas]
MRINLNSYSSRKVQYGDYWVVAKIVDIDREKGWCYTSCQEKGCNKKVELDNDGFLACDKCKRHHGEGILRYRVKVRVVHGDGNAPFLVWDRECEQLVGVPASVLHERHPRVFPPKILALKVDAHCPQLLEESENEDNVKHGLDAKDDEEDSAKDFTQSGSGLVKISFLDEFSSTKTSKKTKEATIEKDKLS